MSYILDALKRADAERERGVVPGLYARQVITPTGKSAATARRSIWLTLLVILTLGSVAGSVALWRSAPETPQQTLTKDPLASPLAPTKPLAPPVTPSNPAPQVPVVVPTTAPVSKPVATPSAPVTPVLPTRSSPAATPLTPSKPAVSTPAAAPALLADLSEDIRRQIPALNISGAVYSENPGQRLLLVNNLVLSQGSQAAPEVKLEEIGAKSSIFSFRGNRFRLAH